MLVLVLMLVLGLVLALALVLVLVWCRVLAWVAPQGPLMQGLWLMFLGASFLVVVCAAAFSTLGSGSGSLRRASMATTGQQAQSAHDNRLAGSGTVSGQGDTADSQASHGFVR